MLYAVSKGKKGWKFMQTGKLTSCVLVLCLLIGFSCLAGCTEKGSVPGTANTSFIVKTDAGLVSGLQQGDLMVYHGIPFAAPPNR